jgi:ABC-type transport system substrate-binding protein
MREANLEQGFESTMLVNTSTPQAVPAAELMAQQLRDINVRVNLRPIDPTTYGTAVLTRGEFEMAYGTIQPLVSADAALFAKYHSRGSRNVTKTNDATLDRLIEQQTRLVRDPEARKRALFEIQRYIIDQGYLRAIHTFVQPTGMAPHVRDFFHGAGALSLDWDKWTYVWFDA